MRFLDLLINRLLLLEFIFAIYADLEGQIIMEIYDKKFLGKAIRTSTKPIAFLVGAPISTDKDGNGVPGVSQMIHIIKEYIKEEMISELPDFEETIQGKLYAEQYQAAMSWIHASFHQNAVNTIIRRAVLKACKNPTSIGDPDNPTQDGEPSDWYLPPGTQGLANLICSHHPKGWGPILTPNFDPLISMAISAAGGIPRVRVLDADGNLPKEVEIRKNDINIIHFHGYWRGSDTLHTPNQLLSDRPKLNAALQHLLCKHLLVVIAYSGWDDVLTRAIANMLHDAESDFDVLWCFHQNNPAIIKDEFQHLFKKMETAIQRGRFRAYKEINCFEIFSELQSVINSQQEEVKIVNQNDSLEKSNTLVSSKTVNLQQPVLVHERSNKLTEVNNLSIPQLTIKTDFIKFLQNTDLLSRTHPNKQNVILEDIFVYPDLNRYDYLKGTEKKLNSKKIFDNVKDYSKLLVAGENQSGRTTFCKMLFNKLHSLGFVPIYIDEKRSNYQGKIENLLKKAFDEQYEGMKIESIDKQKLIPILDNFHTAKNKEKHIRDLIEFQHQIIIVDDIFGMNLKDEKLLESFKHFKIREFSPSLRNELIEKWTQLTDQSLTECATTTENERYKVVDNNTDAVNIALGKVIGTGLMPAFPFFILSILSAYDSLVNPLDQEISSQGHCYHALIYISLKKQGVRNDDMETYYNFLTELAFYYYQTEKSELTQQELNDFFEKYLLKFTLPVERGTLLSRLINTQIIIQNGRFTFSFGYLYLYYFFVAKYLSENIEKNKNIVESVINNLHTDENAYITIFISHHSKNPYILDELLANACFLFDDFSPVTLSKNELHFFDEQVDDLIKAVMPPDNHSPENERQKRLKDQDESEENSNKKKHLIQNQTEEEGFSINLEIRRSIKTVEVMGQIIKNRTGSMERPYLESVFEEAMNVILRILNSIIESIKDEEQQQNVVEAISSILDQIIAEKADVQEKKGGKVKPLSKNELEKLSKKIYWGMNFYMSYGLICKVITSLGSSKILDVIGPICDRIGTPAAFVVKNGMLMKYNKSLPIDNISKRIEKEDFSKTAIQMLKLFVINHCSTHKISFQDKQKIEQSLKISSQTILWDENKRQTEKLQEKIKVTKQID